MKVLLVFLFLIVGPFLVDPNSKKDLPVIAGYDLTKPDLYLTLPDTLREISGLSIIDEETIACIQDENGIVFFYDILKHKIKRQFTFGTNGDYEGITLVNNILYILRSDGVLFEINNYKSPKPQIKQYLTGIPAMNNEGLCYDQEHNRLLIGCKGKINKDTYYKDKRFIYEFNLETKKLNQKPLINFNLTAITKYAKEHQIKLPKRTTKNGKVIELGFKVNTSEIAIHPITKQMFLLSATDHCLFIFNLNGTLEHIEQMNTNLFNKAEGISFFKNGDMIVSNEAQTKKPTLLRFNYNH